MSLDFIDITSILYSFGAVILIVFLLFSPSKRPLSNRLLALYLFFTVLDNSARFVSVFIYSDYPALGMIISEFVFLLAPLLYLFFKSSVYQDFMLSKTSLLHLIPYISILIILIPGYFIPVITDPEANWYKLIYESPLYKIIYIGVHAQQNIYYILIFMMLYKYKRLILENYSGPKMDNYKWLLQLILIYFIAETLALIKNIIIFNSTIEVSAVAQTVVSVIALLIVFWLIIKALLNPSLFSGVSTEIQLVKSMLKPSSSSSTEDLENDNNQLITKLSAHMKENEPYLDSNLSMYELAKQLDVPSRELSVSINHTLNKHFFDFVNEYRIKKAMDLIRNSSDEKLTILEILYEVGFNSKSSFNTAFKKHTGITPTEFKQNSSLRVA